MSSSESGVHLEKFVIPLDEILSATQDFSRVTRIGVGGLGEVYKGQLKNSTVAIDRCNPHGQQGDPEFLNELKIIFRLHHQNIIPFIGYCHEGDQRIRVSEYAANGSLDAYLESPDKRRLLTWADRLKICIGAARGLEYLHSGLGGDSVVIHRDVKSENILLDENLQPKISSFYLSILVERNQPQAYEPIAGTDYYIDPVYQQSGSVNTELDVYSFGVVLFEMLSGMLVYHERSIDGDEPHTLINLVRRYYAEGLHSLIDPDIRDQIKMRSFHVFKEIAYQCISWNLKDRPTMNVIVKSIEQALDFQKPRASPRVTIESLEYENLNSFLIPLEEIRLATGDFSPETCIGGGGFGKVYRGQLSKQWQNRTAAFKRFDNNGYEGKNVFHNEVKMMSSFNHENIIPFIGYCDQDDEMIIVSEFASNGSLDYHLQDLNKSCCLTWELRMKICMGAARGLEYLHSGLGENRAVIHRDMKSPNILLDDNLDTKICGFGLSLLFNLSQPQVYEPAAGTPAYIDPIYRESGMVNTGSDVYSFGIVMFEMLSGMLAYDQRSIDDGQPQTLLQLVNRYYDDGLDKLIDPSIRDQIKIHSLYTFKKIAYRCISTNLNDRPTMKRIIKKIKEALNFQNHEAAYSITTRSLDSYQIQLNEISLATGNFNPQTLIGEGGFGMVYKGQLSQNWQNCTVAIKRLNPQGHQGMKEFHAELNLISRFHHPNIIPFVGYCDDDGEMIIVYAYAVNRSLDYYLVDPIKRRSLTWAQRLNICLGAAKGLDYLHSGLGKDHGVIHRDIKSGNILLDENLEAKICDFGLSTEGPKNQESSHRFTKVAGTNFYMDPIYYGSGILRKESDIYSFGVVLFEMLSGRPAYQQLKFVDDNPQHLINLVRHYYENGPERLIDPDIKDQIDSRSFHTFKEIAYQCISFVSRERPTMDTIIDKLEDAIDFQELKGEKMSR
ncbi:uncharacterized protein LOC111897889 [Lactuca sativa]|uniref:uncharacterized protein LOC111897889 n=1 Tax=Lactuca sativa TaxID=4236 RepID=UPI000CD80C3F|nr:uncharacterized protein LOC111897889 [Lactuca sativa]